jgi:hypothetical protein
MVTFPLGICHCLDCRKRTGSVYSLVYVGKLSELEVTGRPKELVKTADSGNVVINYFCGECGMGLSALRETRGCD